MVTTVPERYVPAAVTASTMTAPRGRWNQSASCGPGVSVVGRLAMYTVARAARFVHDSPGSVEPARRVDYLLARADQEPASGGTLVGRGRRSCSASRAM